MTSSLVQIVQTQALPASPKLLYSSPAGTWTQIVKLTCVNVDLSSSHTVTIFIVPAGGAAGTSTQTTPGQSILPRSTFNSPNEYAHVLNPGDALYAQADTSGVVNILAAGNQNT